MSKTRKIILSLIVIVLLFMVVLGTVWYFFPEGNNTQNSDKDLQTVINFDLIQNKIIEYYQTNKKLPEKLELVSGLPASYEYSVQDKTIFKLCAYFASDVTDDIVAKAPIRVSYKKGLDCVIFNIGSAVGEEQNTGVGKKDAKLVPVVATISENPGTSVKAGSISIDISPLKSKIFKNETDNAFIINFYSTIGTDKECESSVEPESGCCYTLNDVSLTSINGNRADYNRLGSDSYINPFPTSFNDTFGDLPVNFCFNGGNNFSGGISFVVPEGMLNQNVTNLLSFKHKNNGESSPLIEISIKF